MPTLPYFVAGYELSIEDIVTAAKSFGHQDTDADDPAFIASVCYDIGVYLGCEVLMVIEKRDSESYFIWTRGSMRLRGFPWEEHPKDREVKAKARAIGIRCEKFKNLDHPKVA
ncbi:hypothetical protein OPQ81_008459 [Rhizoctonia solani]|nr:hypothetical protein OPQ81_008459 [Rhizoctonia solani]